MFLQLPADKRHLIHWVVEHDFLISPSEAAEKLMKIGFTNWASKEIFKLLRRRNPITIKLLNKSVFM